MKQLQHALTGITDRQRIYLVVTERLSAFGDVTNLKSLDLPAQNSEILLVTMDSPQSAALAINSLGAQSFGERSLIIPLPAEAD